VYCFSSPSTTARKFLICTICSSDSTVSSERSSPNGNAYSGVDVEAWLHERSKGSETGLLDGTVMWYESGAMLARLTAASAMGKNGIATAKAIAKKTTEGLLN